MMGFGSVKMDGRLEQAMGKMGFVEPTAVQEMVFEKVCMGGDLLVRSETGSGKTLAYLLPLFEACKDCEGENRAVVLVPTHELAVQVNKVAEQLAKESGMPVKSAVIVGNVNINRQVEKLREKPQIIIGTAGRIEELMKKRKIAAHQVKTIVLDEGDKLLDENNQAATDAVIKCTMKDRQLLLFSASVPAEAVKLAEARMKAPQLVTVERNETIPANIEHFYFVVDRRDKIDILRGVITAMNPGKALIFINKRSEIEEAESKLVYHRYPVGCIHGNGLKKEDRKRAVDGFRSDKLKYLIATDIAARGLHFEGIDVVYHVSIPENPLDYLHRAGRTGRNGRTGCNVLFVTKEEELLVKKYSSRFGIQMSKKEFYCGKIS